MRSSELRRTHPLDALVAGWFFRCSEVSAGCYTAEGRDLYGREVSRQSTDSDVALQECVAFARALDHPSSAAQPRDPTNRGSRSAASMNPPAEYLTYLESPDCIIEGQREGVMPGYFVLWPPDEIEQNNQEYKVSTYAPGFLCFGSNGGGELFAFDAAGAVYLLPAVGMSPDDAIRISDSWTGFASQITP